MSTVPQYTATTTTTDGTVNNTAPLHFDLNTNPDPVRISPSTGDPQRADFVLVGSRRAASAIECRKITVTVPIGTNSPDLTPDLTSVSAQISLPGWTPVTNTATKTITFTPASSHAEIGRDQGVTVQLMGMRINTVVGSAPLRIDLEWRDAGYDEDPWETGTVVFDIGKFPASFHMANFMAEELIIDNGGSVKLNWDASGVSSLRLLYDTADINVLNLTTYPVNNIDHTTVFYLRATVQVGTNTVERTLSTTVTVLIPDLEVGNLVIHGQFAIVAAVTASASQGLGVDEEHPLENMLDGNLNTWFLSTEGVRIGDGVVVDLGFVQPITAVDIYLGDANGRHRSIPLWVGTSRTGLTGGWVLLATTVGPEQELHYTPTALRARYIKMFSQVNFPQNRLAIRSLRVRPTPVPVQMSGDGAVFAVPVNALGGFTED